MAMPALVPRYTAREIRGFPDDRLRYEVIRGELFVTPAPGLRHEEPARRLRRQEHRRPSRFPRLKPRLGA